MADFGVLKDVVKLAARASTRRVALRCSLAIFGVSLVSCACSPGRALQRTTSTTGTTTFSTTTATTTTPTTPPTPTVATPTTTTPTLPTVPAARALRSCSAGDLNRHLVAVIRSEFGEPSDCWVTPRHGRLFIVAPGTSFGEATAARPAGGAGVLSLVCPSSYCGKATLSDGDFYAAPLVGYIGNPDEYPPTSFPPHTIRIENAFFNYMTDQFRCGARLAPCHLNAQQVQQANESTRHLDPIVRVVLRGL